MAAWFHYTLFHKICQAFPKRGRRKHPSQLIFRISRLSRLMIRFSSREM